MNKREGREGRKRETIEGISSDTSHITSPPPDGNGLRMAMERAMKDGGIEKEQVGEKEVEGR